MINWRQQDWKEDIKEIVPDTSSANQGVNVVLDDNEDDQEKNTPRHLTTSEALQHPNDLLYFSMMENDAALTGLISEGTDNVQDIKLSTLRRSNIERFILKCGITKDKTRNIYIVFILFLPKILLALLKSTSPYPNILVRVFEAK